MNRAQKLQLSNAKIQMARPNCQISPSPSSPSLLLAMKKIPKFGCFNFLHEDPDKKKNAGGD